MSFGDSDWASILGKMGKSAVFELLDYYRSQGGNFIDLANAYHNGQSEEWVGEWMESRDCRDEMVIATKYSASWTNYGEGKEKIQANYGGNGAKSMRSSLEGSLDRLRTSYVDIFYLHAVSLGVLVACKEGDIS
jgi:aryl-alcohol dehydrogenase-like predicted oxidoreductase